LSGNYKRKKEAQGWGEGRKKYDTLWVLAQKKRNIKKYRCTPYASSEFYLISKKDGSPSTLLVLEGGSLFIWLRPRFSIVKRNIKKYRCTTHASSEL